MNIVVFDLDLVIPPKNGPDVARLATNQRGDDLIKVKFKKKSPQEKSKCTRSVNFRRCLA